MVNGIGMLPVVGANALWFFIISFGTRKARWVGPYAHYNTNTHGVTYILQGFKFGRCCVCFDRFGRRGVLCLWVHAYRSGWLIMW